MACQNYKHIYSHSAYVFLFILGAFISSIELCVSFSNANYFNFNESLDLKYYIFQRNRFNWFSLLFFIAFFLNTFNRLEKSLDDEDFFTILVRTSSLKKLLGGECNFFRFPIASIVRFIGYTNSLTFPSIHVLCTWIKQPHRIYLLMIFILWPLSCFFRRFLFQQLYIYKAIALWAGPTFFLTSFWYCKTLSKGRISHVVILFCYRLMNNARIPILFSVFEISCYLSNLVPHLFFLFKIISATQLANILCHWMNS